MRIVPLPPKILACRDLPAADAALLRAFGIDPERFGSLGLLTCDQDDSLYAALDYATKFADVQVMFARSFYAGSGHASGPFSGEILGILGAVEPESVQQGLLAARRALQEEICFFQAAEGGPAFFPHVIPETGTYLSKEAGIAPGQPMAYLIAPPLEATVGLDAALKAADVRLVRHFPPPTETNFAGGYLSGELPALEAAARAFTDAVLDVAARPHAAFRRSGDARW
ncbi:MAG: ethanolamine utilization microcompartment protein EutL [Polyangiaceae bacterium]|jgi:ethanolamine utilization protein EutL|nr:ethanolamine utilization microcompartment protein EutL [Polyangiaceae bacterium]